MTDTLLAALKTASAKSSRSVSSVFHLEKQRLGNGHFGGVMGSQKSADFSAEKISFQKPAHFRGNRASTAASELVSEAQFQSARFVRKAKSQMKRKALATPSPIDRGLLLGRGAFLF
jgi:hypothetical protein